MTQNALVRVRRSQNQEPTLRMITFRLRHHQFCLPLALARRVLPKQETIGMMDSGLIQLQDQTVPIVDGAILVYGGAPPQLPGQVEQFASSRPPSPPVQNILVADLAYGGAVGLIVDGTPAIKRVRQSAFKPVPSMYLTIQHMRGITSVIDLGKSSSESVDQPVFLLEMEALLPQDEY